MAEFLASIANEDGEIPFLGDDDGGRFFPPYGPRSRFARATLATASLLAGKRFFDTAGKTRRNRYLVVGPEALRLATAEMRERHASFRTPASS